MTGPSADFLLALTKHQSQLYASICALLGQTEGAVDVLQETNMVLLQKASEYDPSRAFAPWAMTFARFQVLAWRKRQRRDRLLFDDDLLRTLASELSARTADTHPSLPALERCLNALPRKTRQLLDARYLYGESVQAIAARERRSVNSVSVGLFRIRKALLDCVNRHMIAEGSA
jgi:RNA polymerase sigma-70 factor (ECF subfamily)